MITKLNHSLAIHDHSKAASHNPPDPILIGDVKRALIVYANGTKQLSILPLTLSQATQQFSQLQIDTDTSEEEEN